MVEQISFPDEKRLSRLFRTQPVWSKLFGKKLITAAAFVPMRRADSRIAVPLYSITSGRSKGLR
jgi:hypothetical protein